jgi:para-nitrobenzyl esterase
MVCTLSVIAPAVIQAQPDSDAPLPVNVHNFVRAETDLYFKRQADQGGFGKLVHRRSPASIDDQDVVRMNRDTLYSSGVFDLDAAPVTISLPDPGARFMSMLIISEDHYAIDVVYAPGQFTYDRTRVGTPYVYVIVRTLADATDPQDIAAANALQDAIAVKQARPGSLRLPNWDVQSLEKARGALSALGALGNVVNRFGTKEQVNPLDHLIGTAIGWGGNPRHAADYQSFYPSQNDGKTTYRLTVKDVPVDGFWSVSVYDARGYFTKNDLDAYSVNNLTARANADGSFTIQFGDCNKTTPNCLPTVAGWNYTVRLYRPRKEVLEGQWRFPEAQPVR